MLPRHSKQWWILSKQLFRKNCAASFFPPLKRGSTWHREPQEKAQLFAETFSSKFVLPAEKHELLFFGAVPRMLNINVIRTRAVIRELSKLRSNQATGPDRIGALLLKHLAKWLGLPLAILCRRIFNEGYWPKLWRVHHLLPLFKKGSVYDPAKYRGIHFTCILSKTVERVVGNPLVEFLQARAYGSH